MTAASHYDRVTDAWMKWVMGDELHFGLFDTGNESLAEATDNLTVHLAECAELSAGLEVLDVGCGIGTPARYLVESLGCRVTGISTSEEGLKVARARTPGAQFVLRDATANGFGDATFDRIYSLESAHLMDKTQLFAECFRVLRPGGRLALCDVVLVGDPGIELAQYAMLGHSSAAAAQMRSAVQGTMHRAFGSTVLDHISAYVDAAKLAGFEGLETDDVSTSTQRTLARWSDNATRHLAELEAALGKPYVEDLFLALLHMSFGWGRLGGYLVLTANKPL